MTFPKTNPENHRGNGKYFRNRRAPSPCGGLEQLVRRTRKLGWGYWWHARCYCKLAFTYTSSAQVYVNNMWGLLLTRCVCCPHPSPPPQGEGDPILFRQFDLIHPFLDDTLAQVARAVFVKIVVDEINGFEIERIRRHFRFAIGQNLVRFPFLP